MDNCYNNGPTLINAGARGLAEGSSKDGCRKSLKFSTIEDIMNNLGSLGRGKGVLIVYGPSANITGSVNGSRRDRIYNFACHLITYGFDVKIDMFVKLTTESDWASWIDHEMSQADWIICVCSQSLYTMFHTMNGIEQEIQSLSLAAKNTRFYCRGLYNRLLNDANLKVIPVILSREEDNLTFVPPALRDPKSVLRIFEDTPFSIENVHGNFERLVCRMAGINRTALNTTERQHQGYVKLKSKISEGTDDSYLEKPMISQPAMENSYFSYGQQLQMTQKSSRPSQFSYQYNGHIQGPKQQQQLHHQHPTGRYPNGLVQASPKYTLTPQYVPHQPSIPTPTDDPHKKFHSSHMQENKYAYNHSKSQYHPRPAQNKVSAVNDNLPDSKIPVNSPILLKLSQEVREWKFLGRYLDLEEETIDEIDYNTVPNKTREKALKVFTEWVNSSTPTWAVLGEALLDANYIMLYEKLLELIRGY